MKREEEREIKFHQKKWKKLNYCLSTITQRKLTKEPPFLKKSNAYAKNPFNFVYKFIIHILAATFIIIYNRKQQCPNYWCSLVKYFKSQQRVQGKKIINISCHHIQRVL